MGSGAFQQLVPVAVFKEICNEHNYGFCRSGDETLAITKCLVDIGASAQLIPKRRSTGYFRFSVRFTTAVSNTTILVDTAGIEASTAPKPPA